MVIVGIFEKMRKAALSDIKKRGFKGTKEQQPQFFVCKGRRKKTATEAITKCSCLMFPNDVPILQTTPTRLRSRVMLLDDKGNVFECVHKNI